jgi:hypothetical protein
VEGACGGENQSIISSWSVVAGRRCLQKLASESRSVKGVDFTYTLMTHACSFEALSRFLSTSMDTAVFNMTEQNANRSEINQTLCIREQKQKIFSDGCS